MGKMMQAPVIEETDKMDHQIERASSSVRADGTPVVEPVKLVEGSKVETVPVCATSHSKSRISPNQMSSY